MPRRKREEFQAQLASGFNYRGYLAFLEREELQLQALGARLGPAIRMINTKGEDPGRFEAVNEPIMAAIPEIGKCIRSTRELAMLMAQIERGYGEYEESRKAEIPDNRRRPKKKPPKKRVQRKPVKTRSRRVR